MNIDDIKNIIKNELENKLVICGTHQQIIKNQINRNIKKKLFNIYNKNFPVTELVYLLQHKNNLESLNIFCKCGNKNPYIGYLNSYQVHCSSKCGANDPIVRKKFINTSNKNFGVDNPNKHRSVREKIENKCLQKFGYKSNWASPDPKLNGRATRLILYNVENCFASKNPELNGIATRRRKRGVDNYAQTQEWKDKFKNKEWVDNINQKIYNAKKKNGTLNTSKLEIKCYKKLLTKFPNALHSYRDKNRYPFVCDMYIPESDLFVECHFGWRHGGEPFDPNNIKHIEKLNLWKLKAEEINFKGKKKKSYLNAIYQWTELDVRKLKTFQENCLNYKIFYTEKEFDDWLENI